ncbi:transposable element Tcb2 transposase [Trichonephila clavata]|uniref:Transposable element Tcb2 transposase n=1 Tax=Trichonephila clavata TaxID=2740835 RepID=A0A8X6M5U4_TRICU|nr:transposable element Tcb2 transposase [Trichonephila clavata]
MEKAAEQIYPVVEFQLRKKSTCFCKRVEALVIPRISGALVRGVDKHVVQFMSERKLQLADSCRDDETSSIAVLLGSDLFWECILPEKVSIEKGLFAINSVFGWVVAGANLLRHGDQNCSQNIAVMINVAVMNNLKLFGELDSIGINNECENLSLSDKKFIDNFENNLTYRGNRYETKLPWKSNPEELDCNFETAKRRFDNLKIKLNKNKDICEEYKRIIDEQLKNGIIEECSDNSLFSGYFMPHQAVIRPEKETSRVRIVFDASSKGKNSKSLNDLLFSGPNLIPDLLHIILKFRKYEIAFCGDIEKAFLNITIAQEDRKYLKFLWFF